MSTPTLPRPRAGAPRTRRTALLALLVAAAGITPAACRGADDAPAEPAAASTLLPARPLVGTLAIRHPDLEPDSPEYWLYVNGQIAATNEGARMGEATPQELVLLVVPGEYEVGLMVARSPAERAYPFEFGSTRVTVGEGDSVSVAPEIAEAPDAELIPTASMAYGSSYVWLQWLSSTVTQKYSEVRSDPVFAALQDALVGLQQSPPAFPGVFVDLPENRGGPRELDARQVRLLVEWLGRSHWGWFHTELAAAGIYEDHLPDELRPSYDAVKQNVRLGEAEIAALGHIAEQLEEAARSGDT